MLPYFFLLFFPISFSVLFYQSVRVNLLHDHTEVVRKRNKMMLSMFFLGLFVLLCLRDITVGRDLLVYRSIYERSADIPIEDISSAKWEPGYLIYNKLIAWIFDDYRFFLIITAFVILFPIYKLYMQYKKFSFILIIIFVNMPCFLMMFSGLRQAIAVSIGVVVYMMLEKKKYVLSILFILLACSFHTSAIVLLLLYPACFWKIRTRHLPYLVPLLLLIYIFKSPLLSIIIKLSPDKYVEFYGEIQKTGAVGMMVLLLLFLIFSFVMLDESAMSDRDYAMRNILIVATIFQLFVPIHALIQRASYYFLIFVPISVQSVLQSPTVKKKNLAEIAAVVMGVFFSLYFFYTAYFSTDNLLDVFPYKFFWSGYGW